MGRRALRKLDPGLDLSRNLRAADDVPTPWDSLALFERHAPLEVEVGSGKGLFLQRAASGTPEHNFLGIELSRRYARFTAARLARSELENAVIVHGDAVATFRERLPADLAHAVHIYFPDPWWKKRHHKRRVMHADFLRDVERVLVPGGTLHFWSDVDEYFRESLRLLAEATSLAGPFEVIQQAAEHDLDYRTHFERRTRLHGEPVLRAEFRKG